LSFEAEDLLADFNSMAGKHPFTIVRTIFYLVIWYVRH